MGDFVGVVRRQVSEFFEKTDKKRKVLLGAIAGVVVLAAVVLVLLLGRVEYEVLYSGLNQEESGRIMTLLQEKSIEAKTGGPSIILVPAQNADAIRMELAAEGYPESGLNYDLFSGASSFGVTDREMETYTQYQLQENLRTTILKLEKIEDCIVIVNMASDSLFVLSSETSSATASVMLEVKSGQRLTNGEVRAIGELVSKSVPDLELENVRIVDTDMNLYDLLGNETEEQYTTTQYELTHQVRDSLTQQVMMVLSPVFGEENVSVAANVMLDFDRETVSSIRFETPVEGADNGLAVSMEELYEKTQGNGGAEGTGGTDSNGVAVSEYMYSDSEREDYSTISRTINYELNETQTQIEKQQGTIGQLSVAVLINNDVYRDDYGESVKNLVAKAIGVDDEYISVESMPFHKMEEDAGISDLLEQQDKARNLLQNKDLLKTAIMAAAGIALFALFFRFLKSLYGKNYYSSIALTPEGQEVDLRSYEEREDSEKLEDLADIVKKPSSSEKIEKFIDKNPEAVAQLLRNWLSDEK